jgi:hypothetical protein
MPHPLPQISALRLLALPHSHDFSEGPPPNELVNQVSKWGIGGIAHSTDTLRTGKSPFLMVIKTLKNYKL